MVLRKLIHDDNKGSGHVCNSEGTDKFSGKHVVSFDYMKDLENDAGKDLTSGWRKGQDFLVDEPVTFYLEGLF